jgi:hypothetical protein
MHAQNVLAALSPCIPPEQELKKTGSDSRKGRGGGGDTGGQGLGFLFFLSVKGLL